MEKQTRIYLIDLYSYFDLAIGTVIFYLFTRAKIHKNIADMKPWEGIVVRRILLVLRRDTEE